MKKYIMKYNEKKCIELSKPFNTILVYKIPYKNIKEKNHNIEISNRFIVYILFGKNNVGKDIIYVGKSKNGIDNRPVSHEDKNTNWTDCYILTDIKERTFLNDGTIQYLEDTICNKINEINTYINTTNQTTSGTANKSDMEDCDIFLDEAYDMLYALGLDLFKKELIDEVQEKKKVIIPQNLEKTFNEIVTLSKEINSDFELTSTKFYVNFILDKKIIFALEPRSQEFLMVFNCNYGFINNDDINIRDISNIGHHCNGSCEVRIPKNFNKDIIKDLINQTINL